MKNIPKIVIKVEWLRSSTDFFVMFLLAFLDLTVHNVQQYSCHFELAEVEVIISVIL